MTDSRTTDAELQALLGESEARPKNVGSLPPEPGRPEDPRPSDSLVDQAIRYPVTVLVGVLLVVLFGIQALLAVPIQLTPEVERPVVSVTTIWPGANPEEVEREIVEEQEEQLRSLEGLVKMESLSSPGNGMVTLEFVPGTDLDAALLRVNNALNRVPGYPSEADRPILAEAGAQQNAIAWFILLPDGSRPGFEVEKELEFIENSVEARLERVPGVAAANIFGGQEREVVVHFDPAELAARGLTIREVAERLSREDRDTSAGHIDEGKRRYVIRTVGSFDTLDRIRDLVLREDARSRVYLRDVATVSLGYKDPQVRVRHKGEPCVAVNAQRQPGTNILEVMDGLKAAMKELNEGVLKERGMVMSQAYDSTVYIDEALALVRSNLVVGSLLAVIILYLFLRSFSATAIIAAAIPVSAIGTFVAMYLLGRNINVVSLAGISFAVGMLVDNSIVVLENIFTRIQKGEAQGTAASRGTTEVWGAILASTLTTIAVFLPIFFLKAEIAQLFRDIAVAISCAVLLSLVVSSTLIPMLAARSKAVLYEARVLGADPPHYADATGRAIHLLCGSVPARIATIVSLTAVSLTGTASLLPPAEYLPEGNRNLLFGILIPPPGYNLEEFNRIGTSLEGSIAPLWSGPDPLVENFFFVAAGRMMFMGAMAKDPARVGEVIPPMQKALGKVPGMIGIVQQAGLFEQGIDGGRSIEVKLQGPDLGKLVSLALQAFLRTMQEIPGANVRPVPGLELGQPELRVDPDRKRLVEAGLDAQELGFWIDVLADGARVSEVRLADGSQVDLTLRGRREALAHTQDLASLPVRLPRGGVVPLSSLAGIRLVMGPDQVQHTDRSRTVTLIVSPPKDVALETAMQILSTRVLGKLAEEGTLVQPYRWWLTGTADKLTSTRQTLQGGFFIALIVTYLLMASLYESFLYPLVIMFSVPLASFGGVVLLALTDTALRRADPNMGQPLDVLTMLGFVILVGIVVNNAILLVDRTLQNIRTGGLDPRDAVAEAAANRVRPILMSTLTSVFGMAPLVLMSGSGSELYRGIGAVVLGGLLCSTVFTMVLIPALLSLVLEFRIRTSGPGDV